MIEQMTQEDAQNMSKEYCAECGHIEMCRWYPFEGCEFRSLPSAQPEPRWIPCSERLPEDYHAVLVYEADNKNIFTAIYEDGRWKSFDPTYYEIYFDETIYWNIVAWMPLPKPYEERSRLSKLLSSLRSENGWKGEEQ